MAIQNGKYLQGGLGPFVYKIVNGKQVVSSKPVPGTMKQTSQTVNAANTFGMASSLGCAIRQSLVKKINGFADREMVTRLTSTVLKTLNDCRDSQTRHYSFEEASFAYLDGFDFNTKSVVLKLMSIVPRSTISDGTLTVTIPELLVHKNLKFPGQTFQCKIMVNVSLLRLEDGYVAKYPDSQSVVVTKDKSNLVEQLFTFAVPNGCLCIVSLFLEYADYRKETMMVVNNKMFSPGGIIKTFITPGIYQNNDSRTWLLSEKFHLAKV